MAVPFTIVTFVAGAVVTVVVSAVSIVAIAVSMAPVVTSMVATVLRFHNASSGPCFHNSTSSSTSFL